MSETQEKLEFGPPLVDKIRSWGEALGFQHIGITHLDLGDHPAHLESWLAKGHGGTMEYMSRNREKRANPAQLVPGTVSIISARMNYLPADTARVKVLSSPDRGYISRYALGRDYHKLMRKRLGKLVEKMRVELGDYQFASRPFSDSAPVLEKAIAQNAGAGWIGKNTLLINREAGSWFFLGEIYTDLPLPTEDHEVRNHCGTCTACLERCPTGAFRGPYELDARRCISYLTIESREAIPLELRPLVGNRVFGCDDCQLVCPWNRFEKRTIEEDFSPRHSLDSPELVQLFLWSEEEYLENTLGSALRRAGYTGWMRNIAVALGNAPGDHGILAALTERRHDFAEMVSEHINWAIEQQEEKLRLQGKSEQGNGDKGPGTRD